MPDPQVYPKCYVLNNQGKVIGYQHDYEFTISSWRKAKGVCRYCLFLAEVKF